MPYLILSAQDREIERRELTGPVVLGRAPDCDVAVRDIILSRKHCRIEPCDQGWRVVDLQSRNGTRCDGRPITEHVLCDKSELQIGRTTVQFRAGAFEPAPQGTPRLDAPVRPTDPEDALAGTMAGFELVLPDEVARVDGAPVPQPRPREPKSYQAENVYGMLKDIVSSSWDSIQETNSRPLISPTTGRGRCALSLQADEAAPRPIRRPALPPPPRPRRSRGRRVSVALAATIALLIGGAWLFVLGAAKVAKVPAPVAAQQPEPPTAPAAPIEEAIEPQIAASPMPKILDIVPLEIVPVSAGFSPRAIDAVLVTPADPPLFPHFSADDPVVHLLVARELLY